jgi:IS30 family transposase
MLLPSRTTYSAMLGWLKSERGHPLRGRVTKRMRSFLQYTGLNKSKYKCSARQIARDLGIYRDTARRWMTRRSNQDKARKFRDLTQDEQEKLLEIVGNYPYHGHRRVTNIINASIPGRQFSSTWVHHFRRANTIRLSCK